MANDNYNLEKIEKTANNLAELLTDRENYLKENFPNNFPVKDYAQNDKLSHAIAVFWELMGSN